MVRYRIVPGFYGSSKWRSLIATRRIYRKSRAAWFLQGLVGPDAFYDQWVRKILTLLK